MVVGEGVLRVVVRDEEVFQLAERPFVIVCAPVSAGAPPPSLAPSLAPGRVWPHIIVDVLAESTGGDSSKKISSSKRLSHTDQSEQKSSLPKGYAYASVRLRNRWMGITREFAIS